MKHVSVKDAHSNELYHWSDTPLTQVEVVREGEWTRLTRRGFGSNKEVLVPPTCLVEIEEDGCGCWLPLFLFIAAAVICGGYLGG